MTNQAQNTAELLPCPFCGGKAVDADTSSSITRAYTILCLNDECGAAITVTGAASPIRALERWNNRKEANQ